MKNIYKIVWTDFALQELAETVKYLENNRNIHKKVVAKYNTLYYHIKGENTVEILSFFSNRQDPQKRSL